MNQLGGTLRPLRSRDQDAAVKLWIHLRTLLFLAGLALLVIVIPVAQRLPVDRDLARMLPPGDPDREGWEEFRRIFGDHDMVLVAYRDEHLFSPDGRGMQRLAKVANRLRELRGVKDVWSLDQLMGELIALRSPLTERVRELFENYTHNAAGDTAGIMVLLDAQASTGQPYHGVLDRIEAMARSLRDGVVVGPPVLTEWGFRLIRQDGWRVALTAGLLLAGVIVICSGNIRWVILAGAVVVTAVASAKAMFVVLGRSGSLIDSTLFAVVTVIAVATLMHVVVRFEGYRLGRQDPETALANTVRDLAWPIVLALLTDAVGFSALMVSRVTPVREFALITVIAVVWICLALILFSPAIILWPHQVPRFVRHVRRVPTRGLGRADTGRILTGSKSARILRRVLFSLLRISLRRPGKMVAIILGIFLFGITGWLRTVYETDFTRNFHKRSALVVGYEKLERELGGAGIWDIALPAPASLTKDYLQAVQWLESRLRNEVRLPGQGESTPPLTKVLSLADIFAVWGESDRKFPFQEWMGEWGLRLLRMRMPGLYEALYTADPEVPDHHWFRIVLRSRERQAGSARHQIVRQVRQLVQEEWPNIAAHVPALAQQPLPASTQAPGELATLTSESAMPTQTHFRPLITGYYVISTRLVEGLVADQRWSLLIAICGMAVIFVGAFRNLWWAATAVLTNAMPILLVLGILGWSGVRVNLGSAMMAAVALGLGVDGSIHYLTAYRHALRSSCGPLRALSRAQRVVGMATIYATVALVLGFLSMIRSDFLPTVHFGVLLGVTMLGGLLANLTILPACIALGRCGQDRLKKRTPSSSNLLHFFRSNVL